MDPSKGSLLEFGKVSVLETAGWRDAPHRSPASTHANEAPHKGSVVYINAASSALTSFSADTSISKGAAVVRSLRKPLTPIVQRILAHSNSWFNSLWSSGCKAAFPVFGAPALGSDAILLPLHTTLTLALIELGTAELSIDRTSSTHQIPHHMREVANVCRATVPTTWEAIAITKLSCEPTVQCLYRNDCNCRSSRPKLACATPFQAGSSTRYRHAQVLRAHSPHVAQLQPGQVSCVPHHLHCARQRRAVDHHLPGKVRAHPHGRVPNHEEQLDLERATPIAQRIPDD